MTVEQTVQTCYRHPNRETGLHCTRCGRSACHECLRPAPVGSHCLACLRDGQRVVAAPWRASGRAGRGVALVVAPCVAVFVLQLLRPIEADYSMIGALVASGETFRLVTSMFLHFGVMHLAMNMLAIWIYGQEVERVEGAIRTVAVFLVTGLVGGAAAFLWHPPFAQVAGASGGVFGLLGVALVHTIRSGRSPQSLLMLLGLNLFIGIAVPGISLAAHAGGLVAGIAYAAASTLPRRAQPKIVSLVVMAALVAAVTFTVTTAAPGALS